MTTYGNRSPGNWRKSSYSGNNGNCVEIGVVDLSPPVSGWHKSSHSGSDGDCVEIGVVELPPAAGGWHESSPTSNGADSVNFNLMTSGQAPANSPANAVRLLAVRDSKDPAGPRLHFTPSAWTTFARDIKTGAFGNLI